MCDKMSVLRLILEIILYLYGYYMVCVLSLIFQWMSGGILESVVWVFLTCSCSSNVAQRFRGKTGKVSFLIEINLSSAAIENLMHHFCSGSSFEICEKCQSSLTFVKNFRADWYRNDPSQSRTSSTDFQCELTSKSKFSTIAKYS